MRGTCGSWEPATWTGIPSSDLSEEDLERELAHAHEKRHEILLDGTAEQWHNLRARTDELERGYVERFVVRDRELTSWLSLQTDLRNAGARWRDDEAVADSSRPNTMITSRRPDHLDAFCSKLIEVFAAR